MAEVTMSIVVTCFVAGCAVRIWHFILDPRSSNDRQSAMQESRMRLAVRRPAVDAPVEGFGTGRKPDDDPALFLGP